ncbi:MAG: L,D-transpeptidase [Gemmatimonadales bacterium]
MTKKQMLITTVACALLSLFSACVEFKDDSKETKKTEQTAPAPAPAPVGVAGGDTTDVSVPSYDVAALDTAGLGKEIPSALTDSAVQNVKLASADAPITKFPARIPTQGPVALQLQILLDRANFSPGIVDGAWGKNAAKALAFFATNEASGDTVASPKSRPAMDRATYDRLRAAAGSGPLLLQYTITAGDAQGPFVQIPDLVYEQAKLKCLCYSSIGEALSERFHTSQKLLAQLNPKVKLDALRAGTVLTVPNVRNETDASAADSVRIARLIISKTGFWTHAVDDRGHIIYHFPSTLGAGYDPSPTGDFKIVGLSHNPTFHYQPKLFAEVPDDKPEARLPAGPNSPVGVVWIGLSKPHYGIHGTSTPETIGYANSHGCVRLTNWDASQLSDLVESGTPVVFR